MELVNSQMRIIALHKIVITGIEYFKNLTGFLFIN